MADRPSRADEIIAWIELNRSAIDGWAAGSIELNWGGEGVAKARLSRYDRLGSEKRAEPRRQLAVMD